MTIRPLILSFLLLGSSLSPRAFADTFSGHGAPILVAGAIDCAWARSFLQSERLEPFVDPQTESCLAGFSFSQMIDVSGSFLPMPLPSAFGLFYWTLKVKNRTSHRPTWYFTGISIDRMSWVDGGISGTHRMKSKEWFFGVDLEARMAASSQLMDEIDRFGDEPLILFPSVLGRRLKVDAVSGGRAYSRPFDPALGDSVLPRGALARKFLLDGKFTPLTWTYAPDLDVRYRSAELETR